MIEEFNEKIEFIVKECINNTLIYFNENKEINFLHLISSENNFINNNLTVTIIQDSPFLDKKVINNPIMLKKEIKQAKKLKLVFSCLAYSENNIVKFIFETPYAEKRMMFKIENEKIMQAANEDINKWEEKSKNSLKIITYKPKLNIKLN